MSKWKPIKQTEIDSFFTGSNEIILNYRIYGKNNTKTIVFFYGFDGSIEMCQLLMDKLSEKYRVLIIDYPGHCYSPETKNKYSLDDLVTTINELIVQLSINRFILWGYSFGGVIALQFYKKHSNNIDFFIFHHSTSCFSRGLLKVFYFFYLIFLRIYFRITINYLSIPLLLDKHFNKDLVKLARQISMYNSKNGIIELFKKIIFGNFDGIIRSINIPVLLIGSKRDILVPLYETKKVFNLLNTKKEMEVFDDIGHLSIVSAPERVFNVIDKFLQKSDKGE